MCVLKSFRFTILLCGLCSIAYGDQFDRSSITDAWKTYEGIIAAGVRLHLSGRTVSGEEISPWHAEGELQSPLARYVSFPNETSKKMNVANSKYWAAISKADAKEFTIADFGPMPRYSGLSSAGLIGDYNSGLLLTTKHACRGLVIGPTILPALIQHSSFSSLSITERDDGMCEWEFDFSPDFGQANVPIRGGKLVLDPSRYFLVASAQLIGEWPDGNGEIRVKNTFGAMDGGIPYVVKQRVDNVVNNEVLASWIVNVDLKKESWGKDEASTLFFTTGYGLAEPALPSNRGILWSFLLLALFGGTLLVWINRREQ